MEDLVASGELGEFFFQLPPIKHLFHQCLLFAVHFFLNPVFNVRCEALIQPKIAPGGICYKIARPGVGQLMRDETHETLVSGDYSWSHKRDNRVFHPAKGKTRRQY